MAEQPTSSVKRGWWLRFWRKVAVRPWDCWEWQASITKEGYGRFRLGGDIVLAHRLSYAHLIATVPEQLVIDHLCRNRRCVNPEHLEPVSNSTNLARGVGFAGVNARKTHCSRGHPLSGDNLCTQRRKGTSMIRRCKTCLIRWQQTTAKRRQN